MMDLQLNLCLQQKLIVLIVFLHPSSHGSSSFSTRGLCPSSLGPSSFSTWTFSLYLVSFWILIRFNGENLEKNKFFYNRIVDLASKHSCTPSQLALAWFLHQGNDIVPIPGSVLITFKKTTQFNICDELLTICFYSSTSTVNSSTFLIICMFNKFCQFIFLYFTYFSSKYNLIKKKKRGYLFVHLCI